MRNSLWAVATGYAVGANYYVGLLTLYTWASQIAGSAIPPTTQAQSRTGTAMMLLR